MRSLTCAREAFGSTRTEKHRMIARFIGFLFLSFLSSTLTHASNGCIAGASGAGKSTLLRTLAGVWPYARGTVYLPDAEVLFTSAPVSPHRHPAGRVAVSATRPTRRRPVTTDTARCRTRSVRRYTQYG